MKWSFKTTTLQSLHWRHFSMRNEDEAIETCRFLRASDRRRMGPWATFFSQECSTEELAFMQDHYVWFVWVKTLTVHHIGNVPSFTKVLFQMKRVVPSFGNNINYDHIRMTVLTFQNSNLLYLFRKLAGKRQERRQATTPNSHNLHPRAVARARVRFSNDALPGCSVTWHTDRQDRFRGAKNTGSRKCFYCP